MPREPAGGASRRCALFCPLPEQAEKFAGLYPLSYNLSGRGKILGNLGGNTESFRPIKREEKAFLFSRTKENKHA